MEKIINLQFGHVADAIRGFVVGGDEGRKGSGEVEDAAGLEQGYSRCRIKSGAASIVVPTQ